MIIQCDRCGTRYHFDETDIPGEGAWVRCSRCTHVFFQKAPLFEPPAVADEPEEPALSPEATDKPEEPTPSPEVTDEPLQGQDNTPLGRTNFDDLSRILEEIDLRDEKPPEDREWSIEMSAAGKTSAKAASSRKVIERR